MIVDYLARRVMRVARTFAKPLPMPAVLSIRCREITPADLEGVIDLLTIGFWRLPRNHWVKVFDRLMRHQTPEGFPKYGYLLENNGVVVGVLLLIFTARAVNGLGSIWCNESSYYVDPRFRPYAPVLVKRSHRFKNVTYLDLTASAHRRRTMEVHGYKRLAQGMYVAMPAFSRSTAGVRVRMITGTYKEYLTPFEIELVDTHVAYGGCISMVCEHQGIAHPFVFVVRHRYGLPFAYLIYSRDQTDFERFAGPLGRFLMRRGIPLVALDADSPLAGVPGKLMELLPKFWNGPMRPRLGDLAYTEIPMFGVI